MKIVDACIEHIGYGVRRSDIRELAGPDADNLIDYAITHNMIMEDENSGFFIPVTKFGLGHFFYGLDKHVASEFAPGGKYSEYTAEGDMK